MQTFLPYSDFMKSAGVLDKKRCWKQVVEAKQIISCLENTGCMGWKNHPAVKMWVGYEFALCMYFDVFLQYVKEKHKINTSYEYILQGVFKKKDFESILYPWWLGNDDFHRAMRARLIEKDKEFYLQLFPEDVGFNNGKYFWPNNETKTFYKI